jgi:hypothetical protein
VHCSPPRHGRLRDLEELRNHVPAVSAEGRLHAGHFQPHPGQGQEHLQENHRLHSTTSE